MLKTVSTELSHRLTELAVQAVGHYAQPWQPHTTSPGGPSPHFDHDFAKVGPPLSYAVIAKYFNDRAVKQISAGYLIKLHAIAGYEVRRSIL